jgi:Transposase IS116/IS110/IS902 family
MRCARCAARGSSSPASCCEDYIQAVEAAEARRDRLTAQIEGMLPNWTQAPVVAALLTMRGMALVNATTLVAELGDLSRFGNPRQLPPHWLNQALRSHRLPPVYQEAEGAEGGWRPRTGFFGRPAP